MLLLFGLVKLGAQLHIAGWLCLEPCGLVPQDLAIVSKIPRCRKTAGKQVSTRSFDLLAQDGLLVRAAGAAKPLDRLLLLVICAAVTILAIHGIGAAAFGAFREMAEKVTRPVCGVECIAGGVSEELANLLLARLDACPEFVRDDTKIETFVDDPSGRVIAAGDTSFRLGSLSLCARDPRLAGANAVVLGRYCAIGA